MSKQSGHLSEFFQVEILQATKNVLVSVEVVPYCVIYIRDFGNCELVFLLVVEIFLEL